MARRLGDPAPIRLRKFRERAGLSMEQLALKAGFKHASGLQRHENPEAFTEPYYTAKLVGRLAKGLVGLGEPTITKEELFADLAGVGLLEFGDYVMESPDPDVDPSVTPVPKPRAQHELTTPDGTVKPNAKLAAEETPDFRHFPKDIPVYGTAECGPGRFTINMGEPIDFVRRPPALAQKRGVYAIYAEGSSMEPIYEAGDLVYADTFRKVQSGRDCIIQLRQKTESGEPAYMLKRFLKRAGSKWIFKQFNPEKDVPIDDREIHAVHLVLKLHEINGV